MRAYGSWRHFSSRFVNDNRRGTTVEVVTTTPHLVKGQAERDHGVEERVKAVGKTVGKGKVKTTGLPQVFVFRKRKSKQH